MSGMRGVKMLVDWTRLFSPIARDNCILTKVVSVT
jgi:hypothetical protein